MTDTETEAKQQEIERDSLQSTVSGLQGALMFSTAESRPVLEVALRNATGRLGGVERRLKDLTAARETEAKEATTRAVLMAQQETRLNAQEKTTFAGFMKENFFTKADFGRLDEFYKKSWDRLSERGKDEMSKRIWAGVQRGEYRFEDLPASVREKEAERSHQKVKAGVAAPPGGMRDSDRDLFVKAMEEDRRSDAERILDKIGPTQSNAPRREAAAILATIEKRGDQSARRTEAPEEGKKEKRAVDLSTLSLDGVQLADVASPPNSADIPGSKPVGTDKGKMSPRS